MNQIEHYSRNPLSIIALFVTTIYLIAGIIIGINFDHLYGASERLPLIWFVILFPIIILVVFVVLVVKYNEKLYGPKDFDNQEGFLIANGLHITPNGVSKPLEQPKVIPIDKKEHNICTMAFPNIKTMKRQASQIEENALKKYSAEHDVEIMTEVRITKNLICDGVAEQNGETFIFEVKTNYNASNLNRAIRNLEKIKNILSAKGIQNLHIVLILVSENKLDDDTMSNIVELAQRVDPNFEIENYIRKDLCSDKK